MGGNISEKVIERFTGMTDTEKIGVLNELMVTVTDPLKLLLSMMLVINPEGVDTVIEKASV